MRVISKLFRNRVFFFFQMNFNDEIIQSRQALIGAACKGLEDPSPGPAPHIFQAQAYPPPEGAGP